jgi:hypothetical protein
MGVGAVIQFSVDVENLDRDQAGAPRASPLPLSNNERIHSRELFKKQRLHYDIDGLTCPSCSCYRAQRMLFYRGSTGNRRCQQELLVDELNANQKEQLPKHKG